MADGYFSTWTNRKHNEAFTAALPVTITNEILEINGFSEVFLCKIDMHYKMLILRHL